MPYSVSPRVRDHRVGPKPIMYLGTRTPNAFAARRIAASRRFYNANVRNYNTQVESFPSNVLAGMFNFNEREYFEAEGEAKGPVKVQF